jgi:hypothetical protein
MSFGRYVIFIRNVSILGSKYNIFSKDNFYFIFGAFITILKEVQSKWSLSQPFATAALEECRRNADFMTGPNTYINTTHALFAKG